MLNRRVVKYEYLKEGSVEGNDLTDNSVPAKEKSENINPKVFSSLHENSFSQHSDDEPLDDMPPDNEDNVSIYNYVNWFWQLSFGNPDVTLTGSLAKTMCFPRNGLPSETKLNRA